jgi:hypothetical protein
MARSFFVDGPGGDLLRLRFRVAPGLQPSFDVLILALSLRAPRLPWHRTYLLNCLLGTPFDQQRGEYPRLFGQNSLRSVGARTRGLIRSYAFWELLLRGEEEFMAIEDTLHDARHVETRRSDDALDLLEHEDVELRRLFAAIEESRADTVGGRATYGDLAKDVIQHLATREAALVEVARKIEDQFDGVAPSLDADSSTRRELLDRLEKMSRGVQGINLNTGQDFDGVLQRVIDTVGSEIETDLIDAIPAVRGWLSKSDEDPLKSADYVVRHAPTSLSPQGSRWYERAPVISRLLTIYDRLRDFPRASRHH